MSRHRLHVFAKGLTCTTIAAAVVTATAMVSHTSPVPNPNTTGESIEFESTQAQDLAGVRPLTASPAMLSVGGGAALNKQLQPTQGLPTDPANIFYPGTIMPSPTEVLNPDQQPQALRIFGN